MNTASESVIASMLSDIAIRAHVAIERPQKNDTYTVMKAKGPVLENALSIWDGRIVFYTDDLNMIVDLQSRYTVQLSPCKPGRKSDKYRYELVELTVESLSKNEEDFVKVLHAASTFVESYRTERSSTDTKSMSFSG